LAPALIEHIKKRIFAMAVANRNIRALFIATALCLAAACLSPSAAQPTIVPGSFTDKMDGKTYRTVTINRQTWMADNINIETGTSWCYAGDASNCGAYGRLYDWVTAKTVCPPGWRLPSIKEWSAFARAANEYDAAANTRMAKSGWGEDGSFGENLFPPVQCGGRYRIGDEYGNLDAVGYWWTDTENANQYAYFRYVNYTYGNAANEKIDAKDYGFSVRCVQDGK
jgi:uncharacterized protein (TIGR02145 family)